jgi:hypothetical protein
VGDTATPSKKWTFVRKFRWAVFLVFIAFMVFVAVCLAVGIVSNLRWRHDDLDVPIDRPESLSDFSSLELRDCLTALEQMRAELWERVHQALRLEGERDALIAEWKRWSKDWRARFERLGMSCRLTEFRYERHPTLGLMAEIYSLLDYFQRRHMRLVKGYTLENARPMKRLRELFTRVRKNIEVIEGEPLEPSP